MCRTINITGQLWCDDHTDVYVGTSKKAKSLILSQDFNSTVPINVVVNGCDYLYFVCWSNDWGQNGFLTQLSSGSIQINSGDKQWQVYATNSDKDNGNDRPNKKDINSFISIANCNHKWEFPTIGQKNDNSGKPFTTKSGMTSAASFMWYDSENDNRNKYPLSPYVPFVGIPPNTPNGPNHNEFLIFRIPASAFIEEDFDHCDCCETEGCCTNHCSEEKTLQESILSERATKKHKISNSKDNNNRRCRGPFSEETCSEIDIPNIEPCFHLHWGDSRLDKIEEHDTEILYVTVCNPYKNINFKGLTITEVLITPTSPITSNSEPAIQIVPDKLVYFNCLKGCSCLSREFTLLTRGIKEGSYNFEFKYCIDEIVIKQYNLGQANFEIDIISS